MSLKADVESVRDFTIASLAAAHDHFVYAKKLWRVADVEVRRRGRRIILSNPVTGSRIAENDLLLIAQTSANEYLPSATIQQFTSLAETFLTDVLRLWLSAYPLHLKGQMDVQAIVAAPDKDAILRQFIDQYVLSMGYKRPSEWFKHLNAIVSLGAPTQSDVEQFSELKATRDALVHSRGVATAIYIEKAAALARTSVGKPLDIPENYVHDSWRICRKIVVDVGTAAAARA